MSTQGSIAGVAPVTSRQRQGGLAGTLRGIYIVWYRDLLRYWRDRVRAVVGLAQPLLFLVVFGAGLGSSLGGAFSGNAASGGLSYAQFVYPGVMGMAVLFSAIFGAMSIVWDREFGFLKEILVAPIDRSAVAIGKALGGATQAMIQGVVLLVLAPIIGVKLDLGSVLLLLPFLFILAFALSAMGVALASRMTSMQGFQIVMNFLMMPLFFLSGSLFPLTNVPDWMAVLGRLDPVSYGMDPIRRIVLGATLPADAVNSLGLTLFDQVLPIGLEAAILLAFGAVMLGIGVWNFRRRE
ncbi:MAG TPA: ABC transporter permease [Candidatus Limnocylindria bacterium]|jgi:ABC-2 type transport system permease protein